MEKIGGRIGTKRYGHLKKAPLEGRGNKKIGALNEKTSTPERVYAVILQNKAHRDDSCAWRSNYTSRRIKSLYEPKNSIYGHSITVLVVVGCRLGC